MPFFSSRTAGVPSRLIENRVLLRASTASAVRLRYLWIAPRLAPGFSCSAPMIEIDDASRQSRTLARFGFSHVRWDSFAQHDRLCLISFPMFRPCGRCETLGLRCRKLIRNGREDGGSFRRDECGLRRCAPFDTVRSQSSRRTRPDAGAQSRRAHPDLQGTWTNNFATPRERPPELANRAAAHRRRSRGAERIGGAELQGLTRGWSCRAAARCSASSTIRRVSPAPPTTIPAFSRRSRSKIARTLITDPANGRLPEYTPAGQQRRDARTPAVESVHGSAARHALHHVRHAADCGRGGHTQRRHLCLLPDGADRRLRPVLHGGGSRSATDSAGWPSASAAVDAKLGRRLTRTLGRRCAGRRHDEFSRRTELPRRR